VSATGTLTRRIFLVSGAALGGGLVLGSLFPPRRLAVHGAAPGTTLLATWVGIAPDGTVTVFVPHAEMGQGVNTALPMMLAEELDADWSLVRVAPAPADNEYAVGDLVQGMLLGERVPQPLLRHAEYAGYRLAALNRLQITGGSSSVRFTGRWGMRRAGAAARTMLIAAAANRWGVEPQSCVARHGIVHHAASGRSAGYGELATAAAVQELPARPALKSRDRYLLCGKPVPRLDIPDMVTGRLAYGIDVRLPGMRYAAIRHAPVFGGGIASVDNRSAHGLEAGDRIVKLPDAVAVVSDGYWNANRALGNLAIEFDDGRNARLDSEQLEQELRRVVRAGAPDIDFASGNAIAALQSAAAVHEAEYSVPFLAHATMEPVNCTAWFHDRRLEIWAGTQDLLGARAAAAKTAGLQFDQVTIHPVAMGGGFGRRLPGAWNYLEDAVRIALQVEGPVQLIYPRSEDLQHDFYRPAVVSRFRAVTDADGGVDAWVNDYTDIGFNDNVEAAFIPYRVAHQRIGRVKHETPVPLGFWRSVEHSYQGFFVESFVDELAHRAGADPLAFRQQLLGGQPRFVAALARAAELLNWSVRPAPGHGYGIAVHESFGTVVAQAAHVSVDASGTLTVHRIAAAVDAGEIVNPDIAHAQVEGGIVFGLGAALFGRISIREGRVVEDNFGAFRIASLSDTPEIQVAFIDSGSTMGGIGEVGVPCVAPAVCNAVFAATGVRLRNLPVAGQKLV
jgi:isoquinoline 1-oxidoreductase beta subunit